MSLLSELMIISNELNIPVQTALFTKTAPNTYVVLTPTVDAFNMHCDDIPSLETQEVRISIFSKDNYMDIKHRLIYTLIKNEINITDRRYIGFENDTEYHHYAIDVAKTYEFKEE